MTTRFTGYSIRETFGDFVIAWRYLSRDFSVLNLEGEALSEGHATREAANLEAMNLHFGPAPETINTIEIAA